MKPQVERFPRVTGLFRAVRDNLDSHGKVMPTPWGFRLSGNPRMADGSFEPAQTRLVRELMQGSDIMVNIGANVGYYCCHALSLGKPAIAFEPLQRNLGHLYRNIHSNGWENAEVFPLALTDHAGVLEIFGGDTGASVVRGWAGIPESFKSLVPCSTMDLVLGERLRGKKALVLIDVEGAEGKLLDGAKLQLALEPKPTWILEICFDEYHPGGMNPDFVRIFEKFWNAGYEALSVEAGMRPVMPVDLDRWIKAGVRDFGYVTYLFRGKPHGKGG